MDLHHREEQVQKSTLYTKKSILKFVIPSLIGAILFLTPIPLNGNLTIAIGILSDLVERYLGGILPFILTAVLCVSFIMSALYFVKSRSSKFVFSNLFKVNLLTLILRFFGASFAVMTLFQIGPAFIYSEETGGNMIGIIVVIASLFLVAGLLLPFLTDFGLMDFVGQIFRSVMGPLFKLPGRSAIDAFASWVGSGPLGVIITAQQYEQGYYTKRESITIATMFSVLSIAFNLLVIEMIGLPHMFWRFYLTVITCGLVCALICPRIPPLSRKEDTYYEKVGMQISEDVPPGVTKIQHGLNEAVKKASKVKGIKEFLKKGTMVVLDIWFNLIPIVMAVGTIALIIAEFTPIFDYLAYPFVPLLNILGIPEAQNAAPAMLVGFIDMFLPVIIGTGIESELTRFIIAVLAINQLIYMSEIGVILLKSKIPVSIIDLFIIFLQRTIITLLLATAIAKMFIF